MSGIRRSEHRQHHPGCVCQRMGLEHIIGAHANQDFSAKDVTEVLSRPKSGTIVVPVSAALTLFSRLAYIFALIYLISQISSKTLENLLPCWAASAELFLWLCTSNNLLSFKIKWTESRVCASSIH